MFLLYEGLGRRADSNSTFFSLECQPKINAFALPSKELFVFSGLVDLVEHDELLAAVLAHEMAHVTQRHAVENVSRIQF